MARRLAEGTARIAVLGAGSEPGFRLRSELAARGVAGSRVALYGERKGETIVSEYDGEARLLQEPDLDEIAAHDVVFVCAPSEAAVAVSSRQGSAGVVVDLSGALGAPVAHEPLRPPAASGAIGVAHPLAIVLADALAPMRALGLERAAATILRPAADFGEAGLEELREQTIHLLRFEAPPLEIFGRQLAFNLIPQALLPDGAALETRIAAETALLLGAARGAISVALVAVPIFHGHGIVLRAEGRDLSASAVRDRLEDAGFLLAHGRAAQTPMDAPEARRTDVAVCEDDGEHAVRLWAVAAEAGSAGARQALALAARRAAL